MKQAARSPYYVLHVVFLLQLQFNPEDGSDHYLVRAGF
jgi:hypothetical protein